MENSNIPLHISKIIALYGKGNPFLEQILKWVPKEDKSLLIFKDWEFVLFYDTVFQRDAQLNEDGLSTVNFYPLNQEIEKPSVDRFQIFHISQDLRLSWTFNAFDKVKMKKIYDKHFAPPIMAPKNTLIIIFMENKSHKLSSDISYFDWYIRKGSELDYQDAFKNTFPNVKNHIRKNQFSKREHLQFAMKSHNIFVFKPNAKHYIFYYWVLRTIFPKDICKFILSSEDSIMDISAFHLWWYKLFPVKPAIGNRGYSLTMYEIK